MLWANSYHGYPTWLVMLTAAFLAALSPPLVVAFWRRNGKPTRDLIAIGIVALLAFLASLAQDLWQTWESLIHDRYMGGTEVLDFWWYLKWRSGCAWPVIMKCSVVVLCISSLITTLWCLRQSK
jgi:hypothetical protein